MVAERAPIGFLIATLGAVVLAVSVFQPWYGVGITASGAASAQQELATAAQQYGNATFQTEASQLGAQFGSLAGRQLASVSGHDASKNVSRLLLALAAVSLVVSLLRLVGMTGLLEGGGGQIAVAGGIAALLVLFRMFSPPGAGTDLVSLSLSWGIWLALVSAAAIVGGGFLSASATPRRRSSVQSYGPQI